MATPRRSDVGSAAVESIFSIVVIMLLVLGVLQVALTLYARNVLIASAHEGARAAVERGRDLEDARGIARTTVERAAGGLVDDLAVAVSASVDGTRSVVGVRVTGRLDTAGPLPVGLPVDVTARAARETEVE